MKFLTQKIYSVFCNAEYSEYYSIFLKNVKYFECLGSMYLVLCLQINVSKISCYFLNFEGVIFVLLQAYVQDTRNKLKSQTSSERLVYAHFMSYFQGVWVTTSSKKLHHSNFNFMSFIKKYTLSFFIRIGSQKPGGLGGCSTLDFC